jgi:hypothetical protein
MIYDDDSYLWGYGGGESAAKPLVTSSRDDIYKYSMRIRDLTKTAMISKEETVELEDLRKKIEDIRSTCWHDWEVTVLFQFPKRLCKRCDKEDTSFNHSAK